MPEIGNKKEMLDNKKPKSFKRTTKTTMAPAPPQIKPKKQPIIQPSKAQSDENDSRILNNNQIKCVKNMITAINNDNVASVAKMTITWNASGWIRVYLGADRSDISCEDPNKMLHVTTETSSQEIVKDMKLPDGYTLWVFFLYLNRKCQVYTKALYYRFK